MLYRFLSRHLSHLAKILPYIYTYRILLKGRKSKRHRVVKSDWQTYQGSSKTLSEDILRLGKNKFSFEVLRFHENKEDLAYNEANAIIKSGALLSDDFHNIGLRFRIRC
tara:strand:- start:195 stop:521 length:327 start_codon:yes stop_codon:yes gene_type:complete